MIAGRQGICTRCGKTVALARLLNVQVRDLTHPEATPRHHADRPVHRLPGLAILSFEPVAVDAVT
ncbi:hypothetical protein [Rhodococcus sp. KB6]|uniref:hypothetical protein n=1 Tax=Rhodococcus sp. KB6 TaxID=1752066 RepID=UPI0012E3BC35|nr:hypothetical protein [Rhodococcus sp. KB6]MYV31821.1 hypothetical protein [Rhodococcus erythropolis]